MKVLLYNIHAPPVINWLQDIILKKVGKKIFLKCQEHAPDVVVLNECFDQTTYRIVTKGIGKIYRHVYKPDYIKNAIIRIQPTIFPPFVRLQTNVGNHGVVILSKYPLEKIQEITYRNCCQMDCLSQKGSALLRVVVNNQSYILVATHLQSYEIPWLCANIRASQMRQIDDNLKTLRREKRITERDMVVFVGDMNETDASLVEKLLHALPVKDNRSTTIYDKKLDYILVSSLFRQPSRAANVVVVDKMDYLSDHYLIMAEIL